MYVRSLAYIGCALLTGNGWPPIPLLRVGAIVHNEVLGEEQRLEVRLVPTTGPTPARFVAASSNQSHLGSWR